MTYKHHASCSKLTPFGMDACLTPNRHGLVNIFKDFWRFVDFSISDEIDATKSTSEFTGVSCTMFFMASRENKKR